MRFPHERLKAHGGGSGASDGRASLAEVFFKLPLSAAAGLARDDQVEARHERDQLASGAGLGSGVGGDSATAPASLASQRAGSSQP